MVNEEQLFQFITNLGLGGLALYILSKRIDKLEESIRDLNNTLKEILLRINNR